MSCMKVIKYHVNKMPHQSLTCFNACIVPPQNCECDAPNPHNKEDYDGTLGVI